MFCSFFDEEIAGLIVQQSKLYARQGHNSIDLTPDDIKRFIGVLYFTSYCRLPQCKMYWSNRTMQPAIQNAFIWTRFEQVKRFIRFADNTKLSKDDKYAKIRPLVDLCNKKFMQFGVFAHNISIDERMVPDCGRHSGKIFLRGKPVQFGFKTWCMCSSDGYLFQTRLYDGTSTDPQDKTFSREADVVLKLLSNCESPSNHRVFFNKLMSSYYLMCLLNERKFFATGKNVFFSHYSTRTIITHP